MQNGDWDQNVDIFWTICDTEAARQVSILLLVCTTLLKNENLCDVASSDLESVWIQLIFAETKKYSSKIIFLIREKLLFTRLAPLSLKSLFMDNEQ